VNGHVVIAQNLATQTDPAESLCGEDGFFGFGDLFGFTVSEFDAACCAASVTTACVELIDFDIIGECENEPFAFRHIVLAQTFDS